MPLLVLVLIWIDCLLMFKLFYFTFVMQHVVKAPATGHVSGLQVAPSQQVFDGNILFTIKVSQLILDFALF